jgi:hypothetical protein
VTRALGRFLKSVFVVVAGVVAAMLVIVVGAILLGGGIGDPGYSVTVTNGTSETLVFYVDDVGAKAGEAIFDGVRLPPGRDDVDHWIVPTNSGDARRANVRAVRTTGELFYCHQFGYDELKTVRFHILIAPGVNDCRTP